MTAEKGKSITVGLLAEQGEVGLWVSFNCPFITRHHREKIV